MSVPIRDVAAMMEENRCLKEENEVLKKTVEQMNQTMNRLLNRFVIGYSENESDCTMYK